jgi:hypothetical protein
MRMRMRRGGYERDARYSYDEEKGEEKKGEGRKVGRGRW